jgi:hypothetical protein
MLTEELGCLENRKSFVRTKRKDIWEQHEKENIYIPTVGDKKTSQ